MSRRAVRVLAALFVVFAVVGGGVVIPDLFGMSSCAFTKSWAAAHASSLPRTVQELTTIPREFRRGVFAALAPGAKSAIVRELFDRVLKAGDLTAEQVAALETATSRLTPEFYESVAQAHDQKDVGSPAWLLALDTEEQLRRAFPGPAVSRIAFVALPQAWSARAAIAKLQMMAWVHRTVFAEGIDCQCFKGLEPGCTRVGDCTHWELGLNSVCKSLGPGCDETASGCGISGALWCDGMCSVMDCPQIQ